jgi:hypothetical protein
LGLKLAVEMPARQSSAMKPKLFVMVLTLFAAAGCESMSDATSGVRSRIAARDAPKVKTFNADQHTTYEAVRTAAAEMGYRFVRGGPAQGEFEGISRIAQGEGSGTARQLSMKVRLDRALDGGTQVNVRLTEILEADSTNRAGQATETPLRDTPQYDGFFRRVQQNLGVAPTEPR